MTGVAISFLILAAVLVWGGLIVSVLYLASRPELDEYPPGGHNDQREDVGPIEHDT